MDLSFYWQNLVLLTQRTSISKLLKPNFLYQAPETGTNFHRIIHFFPWKKKIYIKKKKRREKKAAVKCRYKEKLRTEPRRLEEAAGVFAADIPPQCPSRRGAQARQWHRAQAVCRRRLPLTDNVTPTCRCARLCGQGWAPRGGCWPPSRVHASHRGISLALDP